MSPWTSALLGSRSTVRPSGTAARQQLFPRDARTLRLDLRPQGLGFLCASLQVGAHFVAVPEVEGDDGVDVGQSQGVVGADHVFRPHAVIVLLDDQVEADATLTDAEAPPSSTRSGARSAWRGSSPAGPSATVAFRFRTTTGYNFEYDFASLLRAGT